MGESDDSECLVTQVLFLIMFTMFTCNMAHLVLEQLRADVVQSRQNMFDIFSVDFNDGRLDNFNISRFQSFFPNEPEQRILHGLTENHQIPDLSFVGLHIEKREGCVYLYGNSSPEAPPLLMRANGSSEWEQIESYFDFNDRFQINEDHVENNFMWDHDIVMEELMALVQNEADDDDGGLFNLRMYDAMEDALFPCDSGIEDNED